MLDPHNQYQEIMSNSKAFNAYVHSFACTQPFDRDAAVDKLVVIQ